MFQKYVSIRAGRDIEEGDRVRLEIDGDETIGYPVRSRHDRLLLPVAAEDADEGEIFSIKTR
jgi:hypothetical protein